MERQVFRLAGLRTAMWVGIFGFGWGLSDARAQGWVAGSGSYPLGYVYPGWNGPVQPWVVRQAPGASTYVYPYHHAQEFIVTGPTLGAGPSYYGAPPQQGYWPARRGVRLFKPWLQR